LFFFFFVFLFFFFVAQVVDADGSGTLHITELVQAKYAIGDDDTWVFHRFFGKMWYGSNQLFLYYHRLSYIFRYYQILSDIILYYPVISVNGDLRTDIMNRHLSKKNWVYIMWILLGIWCVIFNQQCDI
jgi:hypothetical protein